MKVLLMLLGVLVGSFIGSLMGRILGIDGVYTIIGSIIGAIGMYWLWRKFLDGDRSVSNAYGDTRRDSNSSDRAELLHKMMEERRHSRIDRHRRNNHS